MLLQLWKEGKFSFNKHCSTYYCKHPTRYYLNVNCIVFVASLQYQSCNGRSNCFSKSEIIKRERHLNMSTVATDLCKMWLLICVKWNHVRDHKRRNQLCGNRDNCKFAKVNQFRGRRCHSRINSVVFYVFSFSHKLCLACKLFRLVCSFF